MTRVKAKRMSQPRILGRGFLIWICMVVGVWRRQSLRLLKRRKGRPGCDLGIRERPAPGACATSGAVVGVDALGL